MALLSLPDWRGGAPGGWLSDWEARFGLRRVEQHDWHRPLRGDWIARLEEAALEAGVSAPLVLVADGLGCLQAAAWAAHSRQAHRLRGALLVAPRDVGAADPAAASLAGWRRPVGPLPPVAGRVVPGASAQAAARLAAEWALPLDDGAAPPPSGAWPRGEALLRSLLTTFHVEHPSAVPASAP
jgi:hypothetical protein